MLLKFIPVILIAACAEKTVDQMSYSEREALAESFIQNCEKQGLTLDDPEMVTCFRIEAERETKRREDSVKRADDIGMAISGGLQAYGDGMSRASYAAPTYRQPVNCTSNTLGGYTNTTCY